MSKRDAVLSLCSLLLGVTLGVSSVMYAQEVALSAPAVSDVRAGRFAAPDRVWNATKKTFSKRALKRAGALQEQKLNRPNVSRPGTRQ